MNDEYFVPDIEDLRVGYECEVNGLGAHMENRWIASRIRIVDHIEKAEIALALNYLRTPYLTKEQIEAEGWRYIGNGYEGAVCYGYHKNISQLTVWFYPSSPLWREDQRSTVVIRITDSDGNIEYDGECKSINEFRYICKLLNI